MFGDMVEKIAKLFDEQNAPVFNTAEQDVLHAKHSHMFK